MLSKWIDPAAKSAHRWRKIPAVLSPSLRFRPPTSLRRIRGRPPPPGPRREEMKMRQLHIMASPRRRAVMFGAYGSQEMHIKGNFWIVGNDYLCENF